MAAPNWAHQTMWTGDYLDILRGMDYLKVKQLPSDIPRVSRPAR